MTIWSGMRGESVFLEYQIRLCAERWRRVAVSSLLDLESKYNRVIEEKTLLEQEVIERQELEEECQRLRDDIRGKLHLSLCLNSQS